MTYKEWMPRKVLDLIRLMTVWNLWIANIEKRNAFGWDHTACATLLLKIGSFLAAHDAYSHVDSSANHLTRKEARAEAETAMRDFANSFIRFNPKMTAADKLPLGIRVRDAHPTPPPAPSDLVAFEFECVPSSHLIITPYHIADSNSRGKGRYHGVEVRFWILALDAPPPLSGEHPGWRSEINTSTPWKNTFSEAEIGMRLYVAMRWENGSSNRGKSPGKGPWSAIQSVVIA
jgi:hypothetical protein